MTIAMKAAPSEGLKLLSGELRRRQHPGHPLPIMRKVISVGSPLPVHRLGIRALAHDDPLSRTREIGWRYPLLAEDTCGLAFLLKCSNHLDFVSTSGEQYSQKVFDSATLAEREYGDATRRFQVRLLEIPSIHVYSLWLFAPRDASRFLFFDDTHSSPTFYSKAEATEIIKARLRIVKTSTVAQRSDDVHVRKSPGHV